jgi:hypothetical protein
MIADQVRKILDCDIEDRFAVKPSLTGALVGAYRLGYARVKCDFLEK